VAALGGRGVVIREGWLGAAVARAVHAALAGMAGAGVLRPAGLGRGSTRRLDRETRGDEIAWLDPVGAPAPLADLCAAFAELRDGLNRAAYLGLDRFDVQIARYPGDGAAYQRHRDAFPGQASHGQANRRLSAIYYLNPDWQPAHGGCLRLHLPEGAVEVEPVLDRLVAFASERIEHEVRPTFAPRWAVTAWFYGRAALPL
jgi:SM-20-related protein